MDLLDLAWLDEEDDYDSQQEKGGRDAEVLGEEAKKK
jgi:hypothetical protein